MKSNQYAKISSVISLIMLLVFYNHCIAPTTKTSKSGLKFKDGSTQSNSQASPTNTSSGSSSGNSTGNSNGSSGSALSSVEAFAQTVHPITRQRCANCHGSFQQPLHAVSDSQAAHDAIMNAFKVNMNDVSNSRMSKKLQEGHNCWSDCNANSLEMENAIQEWKNLMTVQDSPPNSNVEGVVTSESSPVQMIWDNTGAMGSSIFIVETMGASLKAPMAVGTENGLNYIWAPNAGVGPLANNSAQGGQGFITFPTTLTGNYTIFGLVNAPSDSDNSFHIKVNNNNYIEWHMDTTNGFEWRKITSGSGKSNITVPIGTSNTNILDIRQREDGTKISKLIFSLDSQIDPRDYASANRGTITYDLTTLVGTQASLIVDIQDYDNFSYILSNLRIRSNANLTVKALAPIVNGQYNPQHSTYKLVDTIVIGNNTEQSISPYSLVLLKDDGPEIDQISFSFEVLSR